MTPAELGAACAESMAQRIRHRAEMGDPGTGWPFNGPAHVTLVLKRKTEPAGNRVRLFGRRGGPWGEFLASPRDGEILASFVAPEVLAWLESRGVISITTHDDGRVEVQQLVDRELPAGGIIRESNPFAGHGR